mmetsp:Transcript_13671/g.20814  ORF Transcript_13671/g.20814 Transcript_13671/m.20814 type:complete len:903 (+) Transcript_13671:158-2866(+)
MLSAERGIGNCRKRIWLAKSVSLMSLIAQSVIAEDYYYPSPENDIICGMQTPGTLIIDGGADNRDQNNMGVLLIPGEPTRSGREDYLYLHPWLDKFGLSKNDLTMIYPDKINPLELDNFDSYQANTELFVEAISNSDSLFIQGGREWRLVEAYKYTKTHEEMWKLLERGGLIAGTAAGASAQGYFMPLSDPFFHEDLIADRNFHQYGFGFLPGTVIMVDEETRNNDDDLYTILNKVDKNLLGIRLPQRTAIVVNRNFFQVVGDTENNGPLVAIYDCQNRDNCDINNAPYQTLESGDWYDLCERTIVSEQAVRKSLNTNNNAEQAMKLFSLPYYFNMDFRLAAPDFRCSGGRLCEWVSSQIQTPARLSASTPMKLRLSAMIFSDGSLNENDYLRLSYRTTATNEWISIFAQSADIEEVQRSFDFEITAGSLLQLRIEAETSLPVENEYLVEDLVVLSNEPEVLATSPPAEPSNDTSPSMNIISDDAPVSLIPYFNCIGGLCRWESNTIEIVMARIFLLQSKPIDLRISGLITSNGTMEDTDFLRISYQSGVNGDAPNSEWKPLLSFNGNIEKGEKTADFSVTPGSTLQFLIQGETSELNDGMYIVQDLSVAMATITPATKSPTFSPPTSPSQAPSMLKKPPKEDGGGSSGLIIGLVLAMFSCLGIVGIAMIWRSKQRKKKVANTVEIVGADDKELKPQPSLVSLASSVDPFSLDYPFFSWFNPKSEEDDDEDDDDSSSSGNLESDDTSNPLSDSEVTGDYSQAIGTDSRDTITSSLDIISEDTNSIYYSQEVASGSLDEIEVLSMETGEPETGESADANSDLTEKLGSRENSPRENGPRENSPRENSPPSRDVKSTNKLGTWGRKTTVAAESDDESNNGGGYKFLRYMSFRKKMSRSKSNEMN